MAINLLLWQKKLLNKKEICHLLLVLFTAMVAVMDPEESLTTIPTEAH